MRETILLVPGVNGSGAGHWQSWMETQLPGALRVGGIAWEQPVLDIWAARLGSEIDAAPGAVWLIAHSFGCLAAVAAAAGKAGKVAGAMLVAPADPERFTPEGKRRTERTEDAAAVQTLSAFLPSTNLDIPSVLIASETDPCARFVTSAWWAKRWGSHFISVGNAGHINVDSGHGPWPQGLCFFNLLREQYAGMPLGSIGGRVQAQHA